MKTIGELIREKRKEKKISRKSLVKKTKIKEEFIKAIEKEAWRELPERAVVAGFVKNIAKTLDMDQEQAVALFRRDYPPDKNLRVNPKPDVSSEFTWSPKWTFFVGVFVVVLIILGYLGFQYSNFIQPPKLILERPAETQVVTEKDLVVEGVTDQDASVLVNNQPVIVDESGNFRTQVEIYEGTEEIVVKATSRSGKETRVVRKINVELE